MRIIAISFSWILRALIVAYRYGLSPVLGVNCRYEPSCSAYAYEAIGRHGPVRGSWLAVKRIFRCHPWGGMGYDPVPEIRSCGDGHDGAHSPKLAKLSKG